MPITVACQCGKHLRAPDQMAGKRIRCPGCQQALSVPAGNGGGPPALPQGAGEMSVPRTPPPPSQSEPPRRRAPQADESSANDRERPRRSRRKQKKSSATKIIVILLIIGGCAAGMLLLVVIGIGMFVVNTPAPNVAPKSPRAQLPPRNQLPPKKGNGQATNGLEPRTSVKCNIKGGVNAIGISDDGRIVMVQGHGDAENVQIWDVPKNTKLHQFDNKSGSVLPVAVSPDGKRAAYATYLKISVRDVQSGKELFPLTYEGRLGFCRDLAFSSDGNLLMVASRDEVLIWNARTGKEHAAWKADLEYVRALSKPFDGNTKIVTGGDKGDIKIWNIQQKRVINTIVGQHKKAILALAVTKDGKMLAASEFDGPIKIYQFPSMRVHHTIYRSALSLRVEDLIFLHDNQTLVYQDRDKNLVLFDVARKQAKAHLRGHKDTVWRLVMPSDGSILVSGCSDDTFKVWDVKAFP